MTQQDYVDDDGGPEMVAVESPDSLGHKQSLHVRVGPVYDGGGLRDEPGVWVEYQQEHRKSVPAGPILLTPKVWRELAAGVEERLLKLCGPATSGQTANAEERGHSGQDVHPRG